MKVKVKLKVKEITFEEYNPETNKIEKKTVKCYEPDIANITYKVTECDYNSLTAIIEISREDYDKIKDKVIEVIEE